MVSPGRRCRGARPQNRRSARLRQPPAGHRAWWPARRLRGPRRGTATALPRLEGTTSSTISPPHGRKAEASSWLLTRRAADTDVLMPLVDVPALRIIRCMPRLRRVHGHAMPAPTTSRRLSPLFSARSPKGPTAPTRRQGFMRAMTTGTTWDDRTRPADGTGRCSRPHVLAVSGTAVIGSAFEPGLRVLVHTPSIARRIGIAVQPVMKALHG
jgi:hypothetical protein